MYYKKRYQNKKRSYSKRYKNSRRYPPYKYRQGRFKSSYFGNPSSVITVPGQLPLPAILRTQFVIMAKLTLTYDGTLGAASALNLKANSLNDPFGTSGTAQPNMYDQLMTFYNRYNVISSKVELTATNSTDFQMYFYCVPVTDITDSYTFTNAAIMPGAKYTIIKPSTSNPVAKLTNYRRTSTVYGFPFGDNAYQATASSDPSALWYWHISSFPINEEASENYTIDILVKMTFYCSLADPQITVVS